MTRAPACFLRMCVSENSQYLSTIIFFLSTLKYTFCICWDIPILQVMFLCWSLCLVYIVLESGWFHVVGPVVAALA